ncbi:TRAPP II complex [Apodospora peruviana]|uniref:TRAPP II complex n=1 Tax=Apodospora peruviana TaxID=516989 RepID=A0AAE0MBE8_9PEZI|nr:TRAPP II complex [Apodospora peruviana]
MTPDPLLPIAPARVKALVLPIGRIKRERFNTFVERLNQDHVVQLRDISPDGRPNRNMFSPLAFPAGAMIYELMTHLPPPSHLALVPFDLYREPLVLIAVADGTELGNAVFSKRHSGGRTVAEANIRALDQELEELRDHYHRISVHRVLIFDYLPSKENPIPIPEGIVTIPPAEHHKRTTMKTVMCDISSLVLAEMTTLAKAYEARSFIDSPGQGMRAGDDATGLARRNSQYAMPTGSRSTSTSGLPDRSHVRMSMPPVPSKGGVFPSSNSTPGRPSTPVNGRSGLSNPPTTFDDITGGNDSGPGSPEQTGASAERPGTAEGFRTQSHDRVSVQGFGPNERWRNKTKSRIQIVLGSLYLQAGRWSDSIRDLCEAATISKSINDHLWYGKALELILINLLLLGWAGIEFQIPTVVLPPPEKGAAPILAAAIQEAENRDPKQPRWLRNLQIYMAELLDRIIGSYSRISAEHLPPLPLSEAIIRFCRISTALHIADGQLNQQCLDMIVLGKLPEKILTTSPRFNILPKRTQIVTTLFRAFPASASELLTTVDRVVILSGIASVLGVLGFQRKKAMVVRELVSVLIGGLVEARTRGAADVGIHPAAGLVGLNGLNGHSNGASSLDLAEGDIEHGVDAFLGLLLKTYGVIGDNLTSDRPDAAKDDSNAGLLSRIDQQSAARFFGMRTVKLNVLRSCINFSEALPDFGGVLRFSSDLLRTAGSGVAPGPKREDVYPAITREEQIRLASNIFKTSNLSKRLGLGELTAEYWDEFLLRGIELRPLPATRTPAPHTKSLLPNAVTARASRDVDPFIYNPFLKQPDKAAVDKILVAGEEANFRLTLQNPYEIEVEVESIRLDTEGVEFKTAVASTVIGPYRTQKLAISGVPKGAGALKVTGAIIKIRGCRERRFPIFPEPWAPENETKIKAIGLGSLSTHSTSSEQQPLSPSFERLKPAHLDLNVIAAQPVVVVKSSTLPQTSVMILEGERQAFSVTLQNLSTTTPVDFLLFSFQDSTQSPLQTALDSRDATAAELYEYELILAKKQALRLRPKSNGDSSDDNGKKKRYIAPGQTATVDFEILGKPGLTNGVIQVDYAYLGVPSHDEIGENFYTRQVSLELTVTVNASVEVARIDILPLHGSIPEPLWMGTVTKRSDQQKTSSDSEEEEDEEEDNTMTPDTHCLLLLDLRNAWPSHMTVEIVSDDGAKVQEHILPGNTSRVILPIKRVYLEDPHAFIPALNPSRQRQFVVSTKISPEVERANREAFWYRERILDSLRGTWRAAENGMNGKGGRSGNVELRAMRLTSRMIEAVKIDEIGIEINVLDSSGQNVDGRTHNSRSQVVGVDEFVQVRIRVTNRTQQPVYPLLRLMPALCHRPLNVALDFTRKLAWNGTLQQVLPMIKGKGSLETVLGATALCRGEFEIMASVEETRAWVPPPPGSSSATGDDKAAEVKKRREEEQHMRMNAVFGGEGGRERRIWHSRRPCRVVVKDIGR